MFQKGGLQQPRAQHQVVPINHMVVVTESLAGSRPDLVAEVYRLLAQAKKAAGPKAGSRFPPLRARGLPPGLEHDH